MPNTPTCRFKGGFVVMFIGFIILGMAITSLIENRLYRKEMIKHGCASYDTQTGVFTPGRIDAAGNR